MQSKPGMRYSAGTTTRYPSGSGGASWISRIWQLLPPVLAESGADARGFADYAQGGRDAVAEISRAAEEIGVFGVPTFVVDDELFWGSEHLPDIRAMLAA